MALPWGVGKWSRDERNANLNRNGMVLSGDVNRDESYASGSLYGTGENIYRVLNVTGVGPTAVLEGFQIEHGRADGAPPDDVDGRGPLPGVADDLATDNPLPRRSCPLGANERGRGACIAPAVRV